MGEWKKYKLGEIATKIGSGATPLGGKESYLESGDFSLIRSQNVLDFSFSKSGLAFLSEEQANGLKNVEVEVNDILLNITGDSVARVCQVPSDILPARVNQHVAIIRGKNEIIDQQFLKYYLLQPSFKRYMLGLASAGATRNALTKSMIESFEILAPDLPTQRQIAQILSSLDDKIELNLQMNQTLEATAQAIFKEWFVHFNFPGFDGELVDGLPKGWRVERFDNHFDVVRGLSYKGNGLATKESGIPMYNLNSVYEGGGFKYEGIKFYNGEYKDKHIARPRDIIIANTEQGHDYLLIGFPAVVPYYFGEPAIFSHHIYRLRPDENSYLTPQFTYYLILQQDVREQIIGCSNGTTVNMLKIDGLQMPTFKVPPRKLVQLFSEIVESIWQRQENNVRENESLAQLRDTLLPKLMSGQLEVSV